MEGCGENQIKMKSMRIAWQKSFWMYTSVTQFILPLKTTVIQVRRTHHKPYIQLATSTRTLIHVNKPNCQETRSRTSPLPRASIAVILSSVLLMIRAELNTVVLPDLWTCGGSMRGLRADWMMGVFIETAAECSEGRQYRKQPDTERYSLQQEQCCLVWYHLVLSRDAAAHGFVLNGGFLVCVCVWGLFGWGGQWFYGMQTDSDCVSARRISEVFTWLCVRWQLLPACLQRIVTALSCWRLQVLMLKVRHSAQCNHYAELHRITICACTYYTDKCVYKTDI